MLPATEQEKAVVTEYFLSQSPGASMTFLQKVYSESIAGHRHDVWDVHASDGRWWIITNPTNLYSQTDFPNMDLAVTFHMGLCLRVPRTEEQKQSDQDLLLFATVFTKLGEAFDSLRHAQNAADYQAIGMRSREALLAFVGAAQDAAEWTTEVTPKRADFRAWSELICNVALAGADQKERRHLFKPLFAEAWVFANWLTHAQSASWHDAEAALSTTEHILGLATSLLLRLFKSVPEQCPNCGSPNLFPQKVLNTQTPQIVWERPACKNCGWTGTPVPIGQQSKEIAADELITRKGRTEDKCVVPEVPLTKLSKPGDL